MCLVCLIETAESYSHVLFSNASIKKNKNHTLLFLSVYVDAGTDAVSQITLAVATRYYIFILLLPFIVFFGG